ncbi:hypothetical protein MBRA_03290 [Mycobacterium branderi]|uniref:Uncharacterized protein n=1 Tax=Mycobacterium branderi TaxID=43348 RepID=A0ABM7KGN8_9MYCO|nr:hypothetical protein MBRA_03290 [Mycobacterium branderi]
MPCPVKLRDEGAEGSPDMALEGRAFGAVEAGMGSHCPAVVAAAATGRAGTDSCYLLPALPEGAGSPADTGPAAFDCASAAATR